MAPAAQGLAERSQTRLKSDSMAPGADYCTFCLAPATKPQLTRPHRGKMCVIKVGPAARERPQVPDAILAPDSDSYQRVYLQ